MHITCGFPYFCNNRKVSKGSEAAGPWGVATLGSEIRYLLDLDDEAAKYFPKVFCAWNNGARLGYEMAYIQDAVVVSQLVGSGGLGQEYADKFQDKLAEVVFGTLHVPAGGRQEMLSARLSWRR